jgi:hypothetical protein
MNLLFSYGVKTDNQYAAEGHAFLGAGQDAAGGEVHVFLKKGEILAEQGEKLTSCSGACVRIRKPFPRSPSPTPEPFTQAELDKRMDQICGCRGQLDCQCVTVFNQAYSELWGEYNARGKQMT